MPTLLGIERSQPPGPELLCIHPLPLSHNGDDANDDDDFVFRHSAYNYSKANDVRCSNKLQFVQSSFLDMKNIEFENSNVFE